MGYVFIDLGTISRILLVDGELPMDGHGFNACPTPDLMSGWWASQPFVGREIADSVDRMEVDFEGLAVRSLHQWSGPFPHFAMSKCDR